MQQTDVTTPESRAAEASTLAVAYWNTKSATRRKDLIRRIAYLRQNGRGDAAEFVARFAR